MKRLSMKRNLFVAILAVLMLTTVCLGINCSLETMHAKHVEDFATYQQELMALNERYANVQGNRIIVKANRALPETEGVVAATEYDGMNVIQYSTKRAAERAITYYSSLGYVKYAYSDQVMTTQEITSSDSDSSESTVVDIEAMKYLSWGADLLGVDMYQEAILEKYGENLPTVYVAVLDTGIDTDHEFLQGRIAYEYGISFYESEHYLGGRSEYDFEDDNSHGTHVSGIIADLTLPNVQIIPVKILSNEGSGSTANILSGMEYVLQLKQSGVNVVAMNLSIGGPGDSTIYDDTINEAYENGIITCVAAGNESDFVEDYRPANSPQALTISSLSPNDIYANFPYIAPYSNFGSLIDLCLPGTDILSCVPDETTYEEVYESVEGYKYAVISGTSMATPHAAALVGLYATYYGKGYNVEKVEQKIKQNTYDWGDLGRDDQYGYGIPNMSLALADKKLTAEPKLSHGKVGDVYHLYSDYMDVTIENTNPIYKDLIYKIYYTLDGSYPSLVSFNEYLGSIRLNESTLLRFVIYLFDESGKLHGYSNVYEATYYKGDVACNSDGTGFEITSYGWITRYTSGLQNIIIPEYINGIKVQRLAGDLFYGLNIESVKCEYDIGISIYPFVSCSSLKTIELYSSEADWIAEYCFGLKEVVLPNISELGSWAINDCNNLERLSAPKVSEIKSWTFNGCKRLKEIEIDWTILTAIGDFALADCESLEKEDFDLRNLESLGEYAFFGTNVRSITLGESVREIPKRAFAFCGNLQDINLDKIESIGEGAFKFCSNLKTVDVSKVNTIGDEAFSFSGVTYVDLTAVSSLSEGAFDCCWDLKVVLLGSNEYLIAQTGAWLSSYRTAVLIDKSYESEVGSFLESFNYLYEYENYPYKIYTDRQIVSATFQFADEIIVAHDYYFSRDRVTAPTVFSYKNHTFALLSWKSKRGTVLQLEDFSYIWSDEVYIVHDYEIIAATHTPGDWIVKKNASCEEAGSQSKYCTVCGEEIVVEDIPALDHDLVHHEAKVATCTEIGWNAYDACTRCDYTTYEEILALGHDFVHHEAKAATCTEIGWNAYDTCSRCDYTTFDEIPAMGHKSSAWIAPKEATTEEAGSRHKVCAICGEELEVEEILQKARTEASGKSIWSQVTLYTAIISGVGCVALGTIAIVLHVRLRKRNSK